MPLLYSEVVGNLAYRCSNSSPRYMRENHYAIWVCNLKISYVSKYLMSITLLFLMSWKELPLSECKISYFIDVLHYIERNYNLNPLLFLGSSVDCSNPCRSFSHCFLNHSPIGCLFTVSTNLLSSTKLFSTLKMSFLISNLRLCSSE